MRKTMRRTIPTAILLLAISAMGVPPAMAGGPITDMWIGKYLPADDLVVGSVGDGIYSNDPATQRKTVRVKPGKRASFAILVQNDGGGGTIHCVAPVLPQSAKFKAKILSDTGADVTGEWTGATNANVIGAGGGEWYYPSVKVSKNAKKGSARVYEFTCTAAVDLTTDHVSARVVVR